MSGTTIGKQKQQGTAQCILFPRGAKGKKGEGRHQPFEDLEREDSWLYDLDVYEIGEEGRDEENLSKASPPSPTQQRGESSTDYSSDAEQTEFELPCVNSLPAFLDTRPGQEAAQRLYGASRTGIRFFCEDRRVVSLRELQNDPALFAELAW